MALEHRRGAHAVHAIAYHLVWCVKYRKTLLTLTQGAQVFPLNADCFLSVAPGTQVYNATK